MRSAGFESYDVSERVAAYDADMEIMHPNRSKMVDIALQVLPFDKNSPLTALELGTGTGYFTRRFLETFAGAKIISIDGAVSMIELAKERLGALTKKIDFRIGDFNSLDNLLGDNERGDIVFSSYALHHLTGRQKLNTIQNACSFLNTGGWFVNADLICSEYPAVEKRIQEIRVEGIIGRACSSDDRFRDYESTRGFLDELEKNEGDKPLPVYEDIQIVQNAGMKNAAVYWLEYREAVYGAVKQS